MQKRANWPKKCKTRAKHVQISPLQSVAKLNAMAKVNFFHDTRSGANQFPLKLRIAHKGKTALVSIDVKVSPEQWNGKEIIDHEDADKLNEYIKTKKALAESAIMKFGLTNNLDKLSANDIKTIVETNGETSTKSLGHNFVKYYRKRIEKKKKNNTKISYEAALKKMMEYDSLLEYKTFEDIDEAYIRKLDEAWNNQGIKANSRAVYFRNIRSVINDAIDDNLTTCYPFRKFSIKKEPTKKRNLSVDELRMLRDYPIVNEFQKKYRDIFMLCFYLRGINAVDLFKLTKKNIRAGRINYIRSKTGKFYSVKIEPEMQEILDRYKGQDYLLDVCDGALKEDEYEKKYKGFLQRMDRGLKKIGPYTRSGLGGKKTIDPILPDISQYWCRHTTATLMADMGYSNEIIACSLGHEFGIKTTNIYIEYKQSEIDAANRALIDFVNEK